MTLPPLPLVQRDRRASLWIASLVYAGYLFGNIPWVKHNLTLIVIAIVVVSLIPAVSTFVQERRAREALALSASRRRRQIAPRRARAAVPM